MPAIGVITLELHMPEAQSLKDKRHFVKGLKDRLRTRLNVAVSEISHQEDWHRGVIAAVTVAPDKPYAEKVLQAVEKDAAAFLGPILIDATVEWLA